VNVAVGRDLGGHRGKPDEIRAAMDDPLAGLNPIEYSDESARSATELHGTTFERFAAGLHEDHRPAAIVDNGRLGNRRH